MNYWSYIAPMNTEGLDAEVYSPTDAHGSCIQRWQSGKDVDNACLVERELGVLAQVILHTIRYMNPEVISMSHCSSLVVY